MVILRQRMEFTDENIKQFQHHIDQCYQVWMGLHALEGYTNYTHLVLSGHMSEFMFKWHNLYCFPQHGWETFNHVFTAVYFRQTNHDRRRHAGATKSKLVGIGKWLQRR